MEYPANLREFWQARRGVSVAPVRYFSWLYRAVWDCDVTMSGYYQADPDENGIIAKTTFTSLNKVGSVSTGRENKVPRYEDNGTTTLVNDPFFNSQPSQYGKIPESWLLKQRHNPCVQSNSAAVYFNGVYRRTGQLIGTRGVDDPPITTWAGAPSNASQISITSVVAGETRSFYAAYNVTFPFSRTLTVQPDGGATLYATHYDPDQNKIWPALLFGGGPATVNWKGLAPADSGQPSSHSTSTSLQVDGVTIPAGTAWNLGGSVGQLGISVRWYPRAVRDL